jgi:phospholipase C
MQENRSFDHDFDTLGGVRGSGDRLPITLASGKSVW